MLLKRLICLVIVAACCSLAEAQLPNMEAGTINAVDQNFQGVTFNSQYDVAPVVFALLPDDNPSPSILRIRDVTTTGFSIAQFESDNAAAGGAANDGVVTPSNISYFAIEPGVHDVNGVTFAAGTHDTTTQQHGAGGGFSGPEGYDTINYGTVFGATPAVITHVQTVNDTNIETLTTVLNDNGGNVNATSFQTALQLAEVDSAGSPTIAETIGWLAVETTTGTFTTDDGTMVTFDAFNSGDNIQAEGQEGANGQLVNFNAVFSDDPLVIGSQIRNDGADGSWLRSKFLTPLQIGVYVQEDQHNDTELNHADEAAAFLAFSTAFSTAAVPEPSTIAIWSLIGLGLGGFGYYRSRKKK